MEIECFSPDVVSLADKPTYLIKLQEIRTKFDGEQDKLDSLLDELEDDETAKTVKNLSSGLTKKFKENDKAVKYKFLQMIAERDKAKPPDPDIEAKKRETV